MSHINENGVVLIPIDFSKQSLTAIKYSYTLARHMKSKLMIMHVYMKDSDFNKAELDKLGVQTAADSGLVVETMGVKGDIFDVTNKQAEKIGATLIVAGLDTHVKFRSFLGKGTASKLINNAPCPVLTIRSGSFNPEVKTILMPFDLSMESREKVPACIQLAKYYNGEIRIVSVFDPTDQKYENKLLPYMNQVKRFIKEKSLHCTNKSIPSKDVAEAIVDYANKNNCDMIVQMNNKDTSFGEMFSGTSSQKMVDISNVPVLTINPMKRANMPLSY
jgi:nucleotide-binding universal stress UspA family protein